MLCTFQQSTKSFFDFHQQPKYSVETAVITRLTKDQDKPTTRDFYARNLEHYEAKNVFVECLVFAMRCLSVKVINLRCFTTEQWIFNI